VARTGPVQKPDGAPIRVLDASEITGLERAPMDALEVPMVLREVRALMNRKVSVPAHSADGSSGATHAHNGVHANGHADGQSVH
jgi:hypothetical protein